MPASTSQAAPELWKSGPLAECQALTVVSGDEGNPGCLRRTREGGARASGGCASCPARRRGDVGSGKRRFLAPVPRPAAPPRHRAAKGARGGSARARRRGTGLGHREARGQGRGSRPAQQKVPWEVPRDAARERQAGP